MSVVLEDGETGHVAFDNRGDRVGSLYDIVNVQPRHGGRSKTSSNLVVVGKYGMLEVRFMTLPDKNTYL